MLDVLRGLDMLTMKVAYKYQEKEAGQVFVF